MNNQPLGERSLFRNTCGGGINTEEAVPVVSPDWLESEKGPADFRYLGGVKDPKFRVLLEEELRNGISYPMITIPLILPTTHPNNCVVLGRSSLLGLLLGMVYQ